jgi:hypothetical protein
MAEVIGRAPAACMARFRQATAHHARPLAHSTRRLPIFAALPSCQWRITFISNSDRGSFTDLGLQAMDVSEPVELTRAQQTRVDQIELLPWVEKYRPKDM